MERLIHDLKVYFTNDLSKKNTGHYEYTPEKIYGVFLLGKRVSINYGKSFWFSEKAAKTALSHHISRLKRWNIYRDLIDIIKYHNLELKDFDRDLLVKNNIFEIKEVGHT